MTNSLPGTDPATNARFEDLGNGMYGEKMATQVQLFYDVNQAAPPRAIFNAHQYLQLPAGYQPLGHGMDNLEVQFNDFTTCYGEGVDPITGLDLSKVSLAGLMFILKRVFDVEYNKRAAAIAQRIAAAEAAALAAADAVTAADAAASGAGYDPATGEPASGSTGSGTSASGSTASGAPSSGTTSSGI